MGDNAVAGTPPVSAPFLLVTPQTLLRAEALEGESATAGDFSLTVKNVGGGTLRWSADSTEAWASLEPGSGELPSGAEAVIAVEFDQAQVRGLSAGLFTGSIDVSNDVNDAGSVSVGLALDVLPVNVLEVSPDPEFATHTDPGDRDSPLYSLYTLRNIGGETIEWSARVTGPAILLDVASTSLGPDEEIAVRARVQRDVVMSDPGAVDTQIIFSYEQAGKEQGVTRTPPLEPRYVPPGTAADRLGQFGITWEFDNHYSVGQFANGAWWVVGPVTIVDITPRSRASSEPYPSPNAIRERHGSMLNPLPDQGMSQGNDSSTYSKYKGPTSYVPALNVALDVTRQKPLVLAPGSSLVSSISRSRSSQRPQIKTAAILTVLPRRAPKGSFRPPYSGTDKRLRFNESDLNYSLLGHLSKPATTPELVTLAAWFERPWIDHVPNWIGRYIHPKENMPDYGRDLANQLGIPALALHLDFTDKEKRTLLIRYVQVGIDLFGIYDNGGKAHWRPFGGHMSGRKWPIIFSGLLLGDTAMSSIGFDQEADFSEDGQTFYVEETSPNVYNYGFGGYTAKDVGLPEWGSYHNSRPSFDDKNWYGDPYRLCCTANVWWGQLLSAYIMGAQNIWNDPDLFDYQDRYLQENTSRGITDYRLSWSRFPIEMWELYRGSFRGQQALPN